MKNKKDALRTIEKAKAKIAKAEAFLQQTKQAALREREINRLEARALKIQAKIEPDWKADWEDLYQDKWYIYFNYKDSKYRKFNDRKGRHIGAIYMPELTADQLLEELNNKRYKL